MIARLATFYQRCGRSCLRLNEKLKATGTRVPEPQPEVPETAPEQPDAPEVVQNVWVLLFDFLLTIIKKLFRK